MDKSEIEPKDTNLFRTEKGKIEKASAEKFLLAYNTYSKTAFEIKALSDSPDIVCEDKNGNQLKLEITLTEDQDNDIKASLGRSEHRSIEYIRKNGMGPASALSGNVMDNAYNRILEKMSKDYGVGVALVVRDVSPLEWDWNICIRQLSEKLKNVSNPFDKGVWVLTTTRSGSKIFCVL